MRHLRHHLKKCALFSDYDDRALHQLLQEMAYRVATFARSQPVALEGSPCLHLGIVLVGAVEARKTFESGKVVTIDRLQAGSVFGEALLFSNLRQYPASIMAVEEETVVMFIANREISKLCTQSEQFLHNFMALLSNKILMLNKKIKNLSYQTIRQKLASYLLEAYDSQQNLQLSLKASRQEMADQLGVPRPSLSREFARMKEEGLLDFSRQRVHIKDVVALEDCLVG